MRYHKNRSIGLFASDDRLTVLQKLGDPLVTLAEHVDFEVFRAALEQGLYGSKCDSRGGRPPFDPVLMFKVLVLGRLYNLSDDALEFQINDRHTFMRFLGLDNGSRVPDSKTIWFFRDQLQRKGLVKALFEAMNSQLEARGIIANTGQIVDATFAQAPRQRNTREENEEIKAGRVPKTWESQPHRCRQKDMDARWAKKNEQTFYGYKNHVLCDRKSKLIKEYVVTNAAVHDSGALDELLEGGDADGQKLYGDSAYRSEAVEEMLKSRSIRSRIHEKGYRNQPLSQDAQYENTGKSRTRARVEHVFAYMSQSMGGIFVRGRSQARNEAVIGLMNITYNLCRIVQLRKKLIYSGA
jgi:IS5 family transposase